MNNEMNQGGSALLDLVEKYNSTNDDVYFNQLWEEVKAFSFMISKKYHEIEFEDKISIAQEVLWNCCKKLKEGKNLLTLYGTALNNRYYDTWAKKMQRDNFKLNDTAASLDQMFEDINYQPAVEQDMFSIEMFLYEAKLTKLETALCILLYEGYKRAEIMNKLNMKNSGQYNRLMEKLRNKVNINYLSEGLSI